LLLAVIAENNAESPVAVLLDPVVFEPSAAIPEAVLN
jgi:hypothetical protein